MADTNGGTGGSEPVFRLMYRSHSLIDPDKQSSGLGAIFTVARTHNRALGITGALMTTDEAFVQVLEGDESKVRGLYAEIAEDERHDHVRVIEEHDGVDRTFGRWAMARVSQDGRPDIRLLSNAGKGEIVGAPADPSITPAQEAVLAVMREALALDTAGS